MAQKCHSSLYFKSSTTYKFEITYADHISLLMQGLIISEY